MASGYDAAMRCEVDLWRTVAEDASLLDRVEAVDPTQVAGMATLRKAYPIESVQVALALVEARRKAVLKFGERGRELVADVQGVEQASSHAVAKYKADRVRGVLGLSLFADLCCGAGGDSMALCEAGCEVLSVDRSVTRAWMTRQNTRGAAQAVAADVGTLAMEGVPFHIDPARRSEQAGRRVWRLADYQPPPEVIGRLVDAAPAGAIKLSPGIDIESLPWPGELEFICDRGRLVQAVLWTGGLGQVSRRATRLAEGQVHSLEGEPTSLGFYSPQRYVYTFDAAVERAELAGQLSEQLGAPSLHPKLGLLTSEQVITSPWTTGFELIEQMPWRPKRVRQWLAAHDGGLVEVKTRGKACDPDREQKNLRGSGSTTYTVFVLRFDTKVQALIAKRIEK